MSASTSKPNREVPAKVAKADTGYKFHIAGSRKGEVHRLFDTKGADAAQDWGLKQGLKAGTLKSWFGTWKRADAKPAVKAPAPKATDKPAAKKTGKPTGAKVEKVNKGDRQTVTKADASAETKPAT